MERVGSGHAERRDADRRHDRSFVWNERRTGFDRRGDAGALALAELRDNPMALLILLAAVNVLNLLDAQATAAALAAGFSEGNPFMAALIAANPLTAVVVKAAAVLMVTIVMWMLRRYRLILQVAVLTFGIFAGVIIWHIIGAALFY